MVLKPGCAWAHTTLERKMSKVSEETMKECDETKTGIFPSVKTTF